MRRVERTWIPGCRRRPDNLVAMNSRRRSLVAEVTKFLTVGGVATLVAFLLFNAMLHGGPWFDALIPGHPFMAYFIANSVGMVISYQGSRNWAFQDRETTHADGGITAYVLINLATFCLPMACLWLTRHLLGLSDPITDNISANVVGATMATFARFYLFRRIVFKRPVGLLGMYEELGEDMDSLDQRTLWTRVSEMLRGLRPSTGPASAGRDSAADRARTAD